MNSRILVVMLLLVSAVLAAPSDIDVTGTITAANFSDDGSQTLAVDISGSAGDLNCENCIGPTEISDVYVRNGGDTVSGTLQVTTHTQYVQSTGSSTNTDLCARNLNGRMAVCSSSIRYKTDVQDIDIGLSEILWLRPVEFRWKEDGSHGFGFIAEEVAQVDGRLINDIDGELGVQYKHMVALMVRGIQQLREDQESLEEEVDALEARIAKFEVSE